MGRLRHFSRLQPVVSELARPLLPSQSLQTTSIPRNAQLICRHRRRFTTSPCRYQELESDSEQVRAPLAGYATSQTPAAAGSSESLSLSSASRPGRPTFQRANYASLSEIVNRNRSETSESAARYSAVRSAADDLFGSSSTAKKSPSTPTTLSGYISQSLKALDQQKLYNTEHNIQLRLRPSLGRTKPVDPKFDLQSALGSLHTACATNRVRQDDREQRVYVRRGQRRKLLKSARWRKQFAAGFKEEVRTILKMRKQGW